MNRFNLNTNKYKHLHNSQMNKLFVDHSLQETREKKNVNWLLSLALTILEMCALAKNNYKFKKKNNTNALECYA